ncbi:unnamed protein product [Orchesella dallaii]|uniref:F-box domain-containing protein n=1 Tax=Orchesella dallaii TaxID=48710 RepID=A0ABP1PVV4_9HEXA
MEQSDYNPMLNTVILKNIFQVLTLSDLASCRQVCKTWFEESSTRWRRDMWLKLYEDDSDEDGSNVTLTGLTLENFILELNDGNVCILGDSPNVEIKTFKKFKLLGWNFNSENDELKAQFWKTCGRLMIGLRIERSTFRSRLAFESVVFQDLPNLEEFILFNNYYEVKREQRFEAVPPINDVLSRARNSNVRNLQVILYSKRDRDPKFPLSLLEFIANYRNLKSLVLGGLCKHFIDKLSFEEVLSAMVNLSRNGGYKWAVENLDIFAVNKENSMYRPEEIGLLQQLQFPLSSLTLDIGCYTEPSNFKSILEIYANTLRKLVVFREDGHASSLHDFPFQVELNSLTELRLLGSAVTPNLNFFQYIPNLKSVFLVQHTGSSMLNVGSFQSDHRLFSALRNRQIENGWGGTIPGTYPVGSTDFSKLENTVLPQMEDFILCGEHDTVCSPEQVAALARLMPNLKKVRLGLANDGFWIVCSAWKELELLIIQPCEVNNCGITGIIPGLQTQLPNLNNLTRLNCLAFGCENYRYSKKPIVTYRDRDVVRYTNVIEGAVPYRPQITDEALQEFTHNVPDCKITRFYNGDEEWPDLS